MHIVVYGSGAVGSVLGGLLSLERHDVLLICRRDHAKAIRESGLRLRSGTGDYHAHPSAAETLTPSDVTDDTRILLTVKSQATAACAEELSRIAPASTCVFSFQNGIGNEEILAERFEHVYSGVCRMTCSMLQPGNASFRKLGRLIVGRHPKGSDAVVRELVKGLSGAGFEACVSRNIMVDRWLKLAVNTQSVFHAVIDSRDQDTNEFFELRAQTLEETKRIFKAAKIRAKSSDGRDASIDEMIAGLRRPRATRASHGIKVHNSTWQDLYLQRETLECPLFHKTLLSLAREHNVASPYNEVALEIIGEIHGSGRGPETMRLSEVLAAIRDRKAAQ